MIRAALLLAAVAVLCAGPAGAAGDAPADSRSVFAAFDSLVGGAEARDIFALPPARYWRAPGDLRVTVSGGRGRNPAALLSALAADFEAASGRRIAVGAVAEARLPEKAAPDALEIVIAGRDEGAAFGAVLGVGAELVGRFRDGDWPALFRFRRDDLSAGAPRSGTVILADDLDAGALETFMGISLVWALGGASLGNELDILARPGGRPGLTGRGRAVLSLMYHPDLYSGMPLDEARATARRILGLGR